MKYIQAADSPYELPTVELTRRNLTTLLAKLDDARSQRTLIDGEHTVAVHAVEEDDPVLVDGPTNVAVKAVEDEEHYANRPPGEVYMPSEGRSY